MSPVYKAEALCLGTLLSGNRHFSIPIFQRSYSWTAREVSQLLSDLWLGLMDWRQGTPGYGGLFLGSLVVVDSNVWPQSGMLPPPGQLAPFQVIDGKQRLTTLTVILAALRDRIAVATPWIDNMIARIATAEDGAQLKSRLTLGLEEDSYFDAQVRRPGSTVLPIEPDSDDRGGRNIRACQQVVLEDLDERTDEELAAFATFLRDKVVMAVISAPDLETGFRIFLSTNHRGKPLTATDILKAELMADLPERVREQYLERWWQLEKQLGDGFEQLPGHLRAIYGRTHGSAIGEVLSVSQQQGGAKRFLETVLFPMAEAMVPVLAAAHTGSPQSPRINRTLRYLNWLRARDWLPPLLAFVGRSPDQPEALAGFLEALERLAYGMQIMGLGADRRVARYREVTEAVVRDNATDDPAGPLVLTAEEQGRVVFNATSNLYQRSQTNCKLLLKRLSASYPGDEAMDILADVSVEHFLPRILPIDSLWRLEIPNAEEREACCRLLGNLVLVSRQHNKDAKNRAMADKQRILFPDGQPSPHAITNQIMHVTSWKAADIRARDAQLVQRMREIWNLTGKAKPKPPRPQKSN